MVSEPSSRTELGEMACEMRLASVSVMFEHCRDSSSDNSEVQDEGRHEHCGGNEDRQDCCHLCETVHGQPNA